MNRWINTIVHVNDSFKDLLIKDVENIVIIKKYMGEKYLFGQFYKTGKKMLVGIETGYK